MDQGSRILVWDLPARIFHWGFAASLSGAIGIGFLAEDEGPLFRWHMILGVVALFLLVLRLAMGLVGSRYSRFSSFPLRPREVVGYFVRAVFSGTRRYAGNNPGSALAAVCMFLLVPALFLSGAGFAGEAGGEVHESLAWGLGAVIALHLAGLAWHTFRHRENISLAMVSGRKRGRPEESIASSHPVWGLALLLVSAGWIVALVGGHRPGAASLRLPGIGLTVPLGEDAVEERGHHHGHHDDD